MTPRPPDFGERLRHGPPVLLDGALGTELERRGAGTALPLWSAGALVEAQATVLEVHTEYVLAGAEVLTACTFRTNPRTVGRAGMAGRDAVLTQRAVDLAREAAANAAHPVWVAGSVAPAEDCFRPELVPPAAELAEEHARHAANLRAAGVDFALIETMNTAREAAVALTCAREAGLPAGVCWVLRDAGHLLGGDPLGEAVAGVAAMAPLFVGLNCNSPELTTEALRELRRHWSGPAAAYANLGRTGAGGWRRAGGPADLVRYREAAREWVRGGARLVGGCCGTGPALIAGLRRDLRAAQGAEGGAA
ncbi:MAG TPA: homocysteine S-methyltransferase family protein [Candidatus Saccharimonadales bacterium]|nr:homocysteine S-methyltransferase family protein [Candidatus Saccharimonadales bacterium]